MLFFEYKVPCILVEFSQNSLNYILAIYDTFQGTDIETNFMAFSIFAVSNPKQSPIILNHKIVCSEQNVFLKNESSNTVRDHESSVINIVLEKSSQSLFLSCRCSRLRFQAQSILEQNKKG